jgi:hypothetical protein
MAIRSFFHVLSALVLLTSTFACSDGRASASAVRSGEPLAKPFARYPHAHWRFASGEELNRTVLWASHILIMHRLSQSENSGFRWLGWSPDTVPNRSPEEALALATRVMEKAQAEPSRFAELARTYSEDVVTKDRGGSLGPLRPSVLPPPFVDALAALSDGEVSRLVVSPLGYHIVLKRAAPPQEEIAGTHIVIRYASTFGDEPSARSRADALHLAQQITSEARAGKDFGALVRRYSEAPDVERGGDLGVRTLDVVDVSARVIEALSEIPVGEVLAEPVETFRGFEVAKRVPVTPHTEFGLLVAQFPYAAEPGDEDRSRARAEALIAQAHRDPSALERAPGVDRVRFYDGQGDAMLTAIASGLRIGEFTHTPTRWHGTHSVVQRVDPRLLPAAAPLRYDLPSPELVDVEDILRGTAPSSVAGGIHDLIRLVAPMGLSQAEAANVERCFLALEAAFRAAKNGDELVAAYRTTLRQFHRDLSEATYARVLRNIRVWIGERILSYPE